MVVGLVSEVDAKLGRVKVKFPWMEPPQASHWAPIASPMSGKKRGALFMPELDDEVLVAFEHGDFDHPVRRRVPVERRGRSARRRKTNRVIVTPGGHELRFEDKDGDRRIVLKTADGHTLTLDDKAKSITLESKQGHKLEILDQDGKVTLTTKSGGKVTLDDQPGRRSSKRARTRSRSARTGITIDVTAGNLTIKSPAVTNIEATGATTVKSSGAIDGRSPTRR